jgi:Domain of unknown function (DUF3332)
MTRKTTRGTTSAMQRTIASLVLMTFLPLASTGCFGGFQLTRKVYQFNKDISPDKWIRELAFLVMLVLPVYGFATLLDAIFLNSVEFWTGSNPVLAQNGASRKITTAEGTAILTRTSEDTIDVQLRGTDGRESHFVMKREGDGFSARTTDGELVARVAEVDGEPIVFRAGI